MMNEDAERFRSEVIQVWSRDCDVDFGTGLPKNAQDVEEIRLTEKNWTLEPDGDDAVIKDSSGREIRRLTQAEHNWLRKAAITD